MGTTAGETWASLLHPNEVERRRLQLFGDAFDADTCRHLRDLGVGEGWRCLEVGAGEGSVARWLSGQVGDGGRVVAADVDTRFLDFHDAGNVDVVRHDVRTDPCPGDPFDLIHARDVLMHLPARDEIIGRMVTWLRPGGWIVLDDLFVLPDLCSPALVSRFWAGVVGVIGARLGSDCGWALTLPGPLASAGLVETGASVAIPPTSPPAGAPADHPRPPVLELSLRTLEQLRPAMAQLGLLTDEEAGATAELLTARDPSIISYGLGLVTAWGRRPAVG
jgi:SAM-dependent methyltransferase